MIATAQRSSTAQRKAINTGCCAPHRQDGAYGEEGGGGGAPHRQDGAYATRNSKKKRIAPRHITLAVHNDEELDKLLGNVTIAAGGVIPHIHSALRPTNVDKL